MLYMFQENNAEAQHYVGKCAFKGKDPFQNYV